KDAARRLVPRNEAPPQLREALRAQGAGEGGGGPPGAQAGAQADGTRRLLTPGPSGLRIETNSPPVPAPQRTVSARAGCSATMHSRATAASPKSVPILPGLARLAERYDGFILDLWGTIHDGLRPWAGAVECLAELKRRGKRVLLLSNAPRRSYLAIA